MISLFTAVLLFAAPVPAHAKPAAHPPTAQQPHAAKMTVTAVRPVFREAHVFMVRGYTAQQPQGGYQWNNTFQFSPRADGKGVLKITLAATAPVNASWVTGIPANDFKFGHRIEVAALKGKRGTFDVQVVDASGTELFRGEIPN